MNQSSVEWPCDLYWVLPLDSRTDSLELNMIFLGLAKLILALGNVILNTSSILAIYSIKKRRTGETNLILLCMAATDLLTGIVDQPVCAAYCFLWSQGKLVCELARTCGALAYFIHMNSFLMLILAATERFLIIMFPLKHERYMNNKRIMFSIICLWLYNGLLILLYELEGKTMRAVVIVLSVSTLVIGSSWIAFAYYRIFNAAKKARKQIEANQTKLSSATDPDENPHQRKISQVSHTKKKMDLAFVASILVFICVVCFTPYGIIAAILYFGRSGNKYLTVASYWFWVVILMNSSLNPILYCLLNKDIRGTVFRLWQVRNRGFRLQRNQVSTVSLEATINGSSVRNKNRYQIKSFQDLHVIKEQDAAGQM